MRNILVLRGGALGDFIVTLPALARLRSRWPAARIELVGNAVAAELALSRQLLDAAYSQHERRWAALFTREPLPEDLAAWLGRFDLVLNYWPDPDGELRARFPLREGQRFLSAEAMPTVAPAAAHYCAPLRTLGIEGEEHQYPLHPVTLRGSGGTVPALTRRATIVIHPGSGSPRKNWPAESWRQLIARLPEPPTVILGEAELAAWSHVPELKALELMVNRPLEQLVAAFADCRVFVGHDSGISHLAAACGARCVLLFGPTAAEMWAPPAPNVRVIQRGPDLRSISVPDVASAVAAALADQT